MGTEGDSEDNGSCVQSFSSTGSPGLPQKEAVKLLLFHTHTAHKTVKETL